jgi:hypothetical protein
MEDIQGGKGIKKEKVSNLQEHLDNQ